MYTLVKASDGVLSPLYRFTISLVLHVFNAQEYFLISVPLVLVLAEDTFLKYLTY